MLTLLRRSSLAPMSAYSLAEIINTTKINKENYTRDLTKCKRLADEKNLQLQTQPRINVSKCEKHYCCE